MDLRYVVAPLVRSRPWLTFFAVICFLNALILAISLWGIVLAWIPLWIGALLVRAASRLRRFDESDREENMREAIEKVVLALKIVAICFIVQIGIAVIAITGAIASWLA